MDFQALKDFFMWCTVLNGAVFVLWIVFLTLTPNLVYRIQSNFMALPRQTYDVVIYSFLGFFKIVFLVFNVVPWFALMMIG